MLEWHLGLGLALGPIATVISTYFLKHRIYQVDLRNEFDFWDLGNQLQGTLTNALEIYHNALRQRRDLTEEQIRAIVERAINEAFEAATAGPNGTEVPLSRFEQLAAEFRRRRRNKYDPSEGSGSSGSIPLPLDIQHVNIRGIQSEESGASDLEEMEVSKNTASSNGKGKTIEKRTRWGYGSNNAGEKEDLVIEEVGDILQTLDDSVIMHACNCQGSWGAGVARILKKEFPAAHKVQKAYCQSAKSQMHILGTAFIVPPQEADIARGSGRHFIACIFTKIEAGQPGDDRERADIVEATKSAVKDFAAQYRGLQNDPNARIGDCYSVLMNAGIFGIPWPFTKRALQRTGLPITVLYQEKDRNLLIPNEDRIKEFDAMMKVEHAKVKETTKQALAAASELSNSAKVHQPSPAKSSNKSKQRTTPKETISEETSSTKVSGKGRATALSAKASKAGSKEPASTKASLTRSTNKSSKQQRPTPAKTARLKKRPAAASITKTPAKGAAAKQQTAGSTKSVKKLPAETRIKTSKTASAIASDDASSTRYLLRKRGALDEEDKEDHKTVKKVKIA